MAAQCSATSSSKTSIGSVSSALCHSALSILYQVSPKHTRRNRRFSEVPPEQPVGVLIDAALPRWVRAAGTDGQIGENRKLGKAAHFLALISG
jgi:hypothetical protein